MRPTCHAGLGLFAQPTVTLFADPHFLRSGQIGPKAQRVALEGKRFATGLRDAGVGARGRVCARSLCRPGGQPRGPWGVLEALEVAVGGEDRWRPRSHPVVGEEGYRPGGQGSRPSAVDPELALTRRLPRQPYSSVTRRSRTDGREVRLLLFPAAGSERAGHRERFSRRARLTRTGGLRPPTHKGIEKVGTDRTIEGAESRGGSTATPWRRSSPKSRPAATVADLDGRPRETRWPPIPALLPAQGLG